MKKVKAPTIVELELGKLENLAYAWFAKYIDKLMIEKPTNKSELNNPQSVAEYKIGANKTKKMKRQLSAIKKTVVHLNIIALMFLFACGSDNPVNNEPPPSESLVFFIDSLTVSNAVVNDTNFTLSDCAKIKIEFSCSTNADGLNSYALYRLTVSDSSTTFLDTINNSVPNLNGNHSFTLNVTSLTYIKLLAQLTPINTSYYMRLKSIKIFKM